MTDGIVTLQAARKASPAGRRIAAEIRHLEGVVAVSDQLTYPSESHS